jgi:hypothetical protein
MLGAARTAEYAGWWGIPTGGNNIQIITISGTTYRIHTFTTSGQFGTGGPVPATIEYLIVGAGGGGGSFGGGGGGGGSIFGNGASVNFISSNSLSTYGGGGAGNSVSGLPTSGAGFIGGGASYGLNSTAPASLTALSQPNSGLNKFSIDFLGTGGGGIGQCNGRNGGGGGEANGSAVTGGIPGGGGGAGVSSGLGAPGLVIVEW